MIQTMSSSTFNESGLKIQNQFVDGQGMTNGIEATKEKNHTLIIEVRPTSMSLSKQAADGTIRCTCNSHEHVATCVASGHNYSRYRNVESPVSDGRTSSLTAVNGEAEQVIQETVITESPGISYTVQRTVTKSSLKQEFGNAWETHIAEQETSSKSSLTNDVHSSPTSGRASSNPDDTISSMTAARNRLNELSVDAGTDANDKLSTSSVSTLPTGAADEPRSSAVNGGPSLIGGVKEPDRYGFFGGEQYTDDNERRTPVELIRKREQKWLHMFNNWDFYMQRKYTKVRERCRKGIPAAVRPRAWQYLCGARKLMAKYPEKFQECLSARADPKHIDDIEKDLHRLFPHHELFAERAGMGQKEVFQVLKAYTVYNHEDGYCQAHGPLAAVLLMHMPSEEAFWCLVAIGDRYLKGYYSHGLEALKLDGDVLYGLLKKVAPQTHSHIVKQEIDPVLVMTDWFMCVFSRTLPWTSVLRVWDMFFCEGVKVLFRVSLVLIKAVLGKRSQLKQCPSLYESLDRLRKLPRHVMDPDYLIPQCKELKITEEDMERVHKKCLLKRAALTEPQTAAGSSRKRK